MPENQEIKTPIETNKEASVSKESTTPDSFSSIQNNPLFKAQLSKYPEIEKNITDYLQKNTPKAESINKVLNNPNIDEAKKTKIINAIIDASIKEINVVPNITNQNNEVGQNTTNIALNTIKSEKQENIEQKQVVNTEEQKKVEQKQVVNTEEQKKEEQKVQTNTEKVQTNREKVQIIEQKETISKLFEELNEKQNDVVKNHPDLKIDTEKTSQKLEESGTIKILKNKGLSDENINSFIKFKATQEAIQADPSIKDADTFLLSFKKLENELNLPDSSRDSFSSKNISQTSQELFNPDIGNQNLIDTVSSNQKTHADEVQKLFIAPQNLSELDTIYGQFLPKEQALCKTIQEKQNQKIPLTEAEQNTLKDYQSKLEIQKATYEQISANTIEKSAILGPIMGLAEYMDMEIGNSFEFNKSNDIQLQNNTLSITGRIKGEPFTLATHLDKASKLETSDYLHQTDTDRFGLDNQHRQETPYILPGQQEIWTTITDKFTKIQTELLTQGLTPDKYQETLQTSLCEHIKTLYGHKELVQARIERQMSKDMANQESLFCINQNIFDGSFNFGKTISETDNKELFEFAKTLDKTLENSNAEQINTRRSSLKEFTNILNGLKTGNTSHNNVEMLKKLPPELIQNTRDIMNRQGNKTPNLFSFFKIIENPKTKQFDITQFNNLLEENKKPKPNELAYKDIASREIQENTNLDTSLFFSYSSYAETETNVS